jgi:hypothetical protein
MQQPQVPTFDYYIMIRDEARRPADSCFKRTLPYSNLIVMILYLLLILILAYATRKE